MKKTGIIVLVLFVTALVIGLDCRKTYSNIDISRKEELVKYGFTAGYCSGDEFTEEEDEMTEEEMQEEVARDEMEEGYMNEEGQHLDSEGNVILDMMGEETDNGENQSGDSPEEVQQAETQETETEYDVTTAWMKYMNLSKEEGIRAVLDDAQYVVVAMPAGKRKSLGGTLQQEMKVMQVLKGENTWEGKTIKAYSTTEQIILTTEHAGILGDVNLMEEGKRYLVFLNGMNRKGKKYRNMAYFADNFGIPYFCLDDMETEVVKPDREGYIYYEQVKDNEFFVSDEKALQKLLEIKEDYLDRYLQ